MTTPSSPAYDRLSIALHWIVAIGIVGCYGLGLAQDEGPRAMRQGLQNLHISLGIVVLGLVALRLAWRAGRWALSPRAVTTGTWAARLAHAGLYALMVAVPLLGLFMLWTRGLDVSVLGMSLPSPWPADRALAKVISGLHEAAAHGLLLLGGLHAAAALGHHYLLRDDVLSRMLPLARRS